GLNRDVTHAADTNASFRVRHRTVAAARFEVNLGPGADPGRVALRQSILVPTHYGPNGTICSSAFNRFGRQWFGWGAIVGQISVSACGTAKRGRSQDVGEPATQGGRLGG